MTEIIEKAISFIPLGGTEEIGMNFYLYGVNGKWLIVDCGVTFADDKQPGIDLILPDPDFIEEERENLLGIVVTHGHEDHYGAISYLWDKLKCPVYVTPFVGKLLETRLQEARLTKKVLVHVKDPGERFKIGDFDVEFISLTHSMPEACAIALRTPYGNVLHTGDWRFDETPLIQQPSDKEALKRLGDEGLLALICDSTNVFDETKAVSEAAVRESLKEVIGRYKGKVAVSCFASNVARVESIAVAAKACNRHVCLVGRSLWRMESAGRDLGYFKGIDPFLTDSDVDNLPPDRVLYICTGSQGEPRAALARIAADSHSNVYFDSNDTVIFSSKVIPGNEKSVLNVQNNLAKLGVEIVTDADELVHASGHPSREELREMYELTRPQYVIPMHGEPMHILAHQKFAKEQKDLNIKDSLVMENGNVLVMSEEEGCEIIGSVPTGCLAIDGNRIVPLDSEVLKIRKRAMFNCSAVVTVVMDTKGKVLGAPQITVTGILDPEDDDDKLVEIEEHIKEKIESLSNSQRKDDGEVWETARLAARRFIDNKYGRKPVTDVHLIRI